MGGAAVEMARVLCIDTDPATAQALVTAGHEVFAGTLGYTDGQPRLAMPPHEVDLIVCDLRKAACFDSDWWGPGRNSNFQCTIVPNPPVEWRRVNDRLVPRFRIIQESQMRPRPPGSFGASEIHRAISRAGVPLLFMLNPEWLQHAGHYSPNLAGVVWRFDLTSAERVEVRDPLVTAFPEIEKDVAFVRPLLYEIAEGPHQRVGGAAEPRMTVRAVVANAVGQQFGQVIEMGNGAIWALPRIEDNAGFIVLAASRIDALRLSAAAPKPHGVAAANPPRAVDGERDVFISHASEDKDAIARPLAEALISEGLTVWFAEYELRLGDRLRERIEDGLRRSRYGAVILSDNFFAKRWPQLELDGLFALEAGATRILPIWHRLTLEDVRQYSPILSERLAVSTEGGLDVVVKSILGAVRRR